MYMPDILSAYVITEKILSKAKVIERLFAIEMALGAMILHYEYEGFKLTFQYSRSMKKLWDEKGVAGSKVRYIQRDVNGNILTDMCREGVLMSGGSFFVSCDRCVSVSFGEGSEAYDIKDIQIVDEYEHIS